ncbi:hypothetical protein, partial [Thalassolituus oleivorans]|uniref:hypothetical protein n=1 Tax=Thalassolituus oleivorans TaxID=187493 RepID=UPI001CE2C7A2
GTSLNGDSTGCPATGCNGYELVNDLDFDTNGNGVADAGDEFWNNGDGWEPVGNTTSGVVTWAITEGAFTGNFDGNYHSIRNMYINRPSEDWIGLFANLNGSVISNLNFINSTALGNDAVGVLSGGSNNVSITNVNSIYSDVTGEYYVGGLLGRSDGENGYLAYLSVISNVSGDKNVGGLIGFTEGDRYDVVENDLYLSHIIANVVVAGNNYVGGVIGDSQVSTLENIYVSGDLSGGFAIGGISGRLLFGTSDVTASNVVINGRDNVGGIYGIMSNTQANRAEFMVSGSLLAAGMVGGLVGQITNATLENSFSMGSVGGGRYPSGAVGLASYEVFIRNVYSASELTKSQSKGQEYGLIRSIYYTNTNVTVENSYWDAERSGTTISAGDLGYGKTTAELQCPTAPGDVSCDPTIFADWDATVWDFG